MKTILFLEFELKMMLSKLHERIDALVHEVDQNYKDKLILLNENDMIYLV